MSKESSCLYLNLWHLYHVQVGQNGDVFLAHFWVHFPSFQQSDKTVKYWRWPGEPKHCSAVPHAQDAGEGRVRPMQTVQDKPLQLANVHRTKNWSLWKVLFVVMKIVSEASNCMCFARSSSFGLLSFLGILFFFCLGKKGRWCQALIRWRSSWNFDPLHFWILKLCWKKKNLNVSLDPSAAFCYYFTRFVYKAF